MTVVRPWVADPSQRFIVFLFKHPNAALNDFPFYFFSLYDFHFMKATRIRPFSYRKRVA